MNLQDTERFHVGAYGIVIRDGAVLLIRKARGPYKGMFDLPGGGIEFGEKAEDAVRREFLEETGTIVASAEFFGINECMSKYMNGKGEPRKMHHLGIFYLVALQPGSVKSESDGQDSLGAEYVSIADLDRVEISPIARPMILKIV